MARMRLKPIDHLPNHLIAGAGRIVAEREEGETKNEFFHRIAETIADHRSVLQRDTMRWRAIHNMAYQLVPGVHVDGKKEALEELMLLVANASLEEPRTQAEIDRNNLLDWVLTECERLIDAADRQKIADSEGV